MTAMDTITIKEMSRITGTPTYTLRFWEKEFKGILEPSRSQGGQRRYSKKDIFIIDKIKRFKEQGISLAEINDKLNNKTQMPNTETVKIDLLANRVAEIVRAEVHNYLKQEG